MFSFYTDEMVFRSRYPKFKFEPYFSFSAIGIATRPAVGPQFNCHRDDFLALAAELGLPAAQRLTWEGKDFSLKELFADSFHSFSLEQELEFTAVAYAHYLAPGATWRNQFGEEFTLEDVGQKLLTPKLDGSACCGTHVPYALAILLAADDQETILSPQLRTRVRKRLQKISQGLVESQGAAGWWDRHWMRGVTFSVQEPEVVVWVRCTGHHLEWIALVDSELRPPQRNIDRAVSFLRAALISQDPGTLAASRSYGPYSHAGRALVSLHGKRFAAELMIENWKRRTRAEIAPSVRNEN